jgi:hypothetical protein
MGDASTAILVSQASKVAADLVLKLGGRFECLRRSTS